MAENSKIEWTDATANFWWGCVKVSPGCEHCYAETLSKRVGKKIWGPAKTTSRERKKGIWKELPRWNEAAKAAGKRKRVFVQSMSDFFERHPDVETWRVEAIDLMERCTWIDFQVLTKRPENIRGMVPDYWIEMGEWPANVWIGTSVEDQERADARIPHLLKIPAAVRFLSCEPLLGPVSLTAIHQDGEVEINALNGDHGIIRPLRGRSDARISWVIVGGESGPGKRPMDLGWARAIRDECRAAGVPFFMKQIDKVQPIPDDLMIREFPK